LDKNAKGFKPVDLTQKARTTGASFDGHTIDVNLRNDN
jgi:hypothetical protein